MHYEEPKSGTIYFSKEDKKLLENYCTFFEKFCTLIGRYYFSCSENGCPAYDFCPKKYSGKQSEYQDTLKYIIEYFEDFCSDDGMNAVFED